MHVDARNIQWYIDTGVNGDYLAAAEHSVKKADQATKSVTMTVTSNSSSSFKIVAKNNGANGANAENLYSFKTANAAIVSSTITYNTYYMSSLKKDGKIHIAVHEIGHTFGLADLKDSGMAEYSIMYKSYSAASRYTFNDFQEFDKANLAWYYD